jgi:hypothetical protein
MDTPATGKAYEKNDTRNAEARGWEEALWKRVHNERRGRVLLEKDERQFSEMEWRGQRDR